jgi:hypothetical protein
MEMRHTRGHEWLHECTHRLEPVDARIVRSPVEPRDLMSDRVGSLDLQGPTRWLSLIIHTWRQRIDQGVELRLSKSVDLKATREEPGSVERAL